MSESGRKRVKCFFSYAHENEQLARKFKALLLQQLRPSKTYHYEIWQDETDILPGENWSREIEEALRECHLGLLLVSPSFLASSFITTTELPMFVGDSAKACIPIMLSPINLKRHDLKGLETKQLFRYRLPKGSLRNFTECTALQRGRFCEALFEKIEDRLDQLCLGDRSKEWGGTSQSESR